MVRLGVERDGARTHDRGQRHGRGFQGRTRSRGRPSEKDRRESAIQGYVSASNFEYFVAESQGLLAGVVALRDNGHLFHLFVAEPFQGQGPWRQALANGQG